MKIFDISLPLNDKTIIYPGNTKFTTSQLKSPSGNFLSEITMGSHTGTHIDAPSHVLEGAASIDKIPLDTFVGPCRVLDLTFSKSSISVADLEAKKVKFGDRILLKTSNSERGFDSFFDDYVYLSPEGANYLANLNIKLVGIDFLSIKQRGSPDNSPHTNLLSKNIPIIEGLSLKGVEEGEYELIALPLAFSALDGSPARIILLKY